jgi:hypothetical protein
LVIVEYGLGENHNDDFFNEAKPHLVPIEVNMISKPSKYSSDLTLLFWFKPEDVFFKVLPQTVAAGLKRKYTEENRKSYDSILLAYQIAKNNVFLKGLDSARVQRLQSKILELTPVELEKLNINTTDSGFTYYNRFKQDKKIHYVKVSKKGFRTDIEIDNHPLFPLRIRRKDKPFTAVALTDRSFRHVTYFYVYPDSVPSGIRDQLNRSQFNRDIESHIPIKASERNILWFPPTPELMNALPEHAKEQLRAAGYYR